jgi:hypothetical protein
MRQLPITDLRKEISLVLDPVDRRSKINFPVDYIRSGIVPGCRLVEILAPPLLEIAELYHLVAHHIRIRRKPCLHSTQRILHHIVPILLMQRDHLKRQSVFMRDSRTHFYILFGRTVTFIRIHTDTYIE